MQNNINEKISEKEEALALPEIAEELEKFCLPWDTKFIEDRILELRSELDKTQSIILTNALMQHEKFKIGSKLELQLVDSVTECLESVHKTRSSLLSVKKDFILNMLSIVKVQIARQKAERALQTCRLLEDLKNAEEFVKEFFKQEKYVEATSLLVSIQKQLTNQEKERQLDSKLYALSHLKSNAMKYWEKLHDKLVKGLTNATFESIGSEQNIVSNKKFNCFVRLLANFQDSKASAGFYVITALTTQIPNATRHCLIGFVETDRLDELLSTETLMIPEICRKISSEKFMQAVTKVLSFYWDQLLLLDEIEHWCFQQFQNPKESFILMNDEKTNSRESEFDTWKKYLIVVQNDLTIGKNNLRLRQEEYITLTLHSMNLDELKTEHLFTLLRIVLRYCIEIQCFWTASERVSRNFNLSNITTYSNLETVWNNSIMSRLLSHLQRITRKHFHALHKKNIMTLHMYLCEDAWQRLPIVTMDTCELVPMSKYQTFGSSVSSFVLWDSATHPSWFTHTNPFKGDDKIMNYLDFKKSYAKEPSIDSSVETKKKKKNCNSKEDFVEFEVSDLVVSNKGLVMSASSHRFCQMFNEYLEFAWIASFLHFDIVLASITLLHLMLYTISYLFSQKDQITQIFSTCEIPSGCSGGSIVEKKHLAFLLQKQIPTLKQFLSIFSNFSNRDPNEFTINSPKILRLYFPNTESFSKIAQRYTDSAVSELSHLQNTLQQVFLAPLHILNSPGTLYALAERVTAVESCNSCLKILDYTFHDKTSTTAVFSNWADNTEKSFVEDLFENKKQLVNDFQSLMYKQAATTLFNLEKFVEQLNSFKWQANSQDEQSNIKLSIEHFRLQLHDLNRRISCAGGGCIPKSVQRKLWVAIGKHTLECCLEGIAYNSNPIYFTEAGPPESLFGLIEDINSLLIRITCMIETKQDSEKQQTEQETLNMSFLTDYIEAFCLEPQELLHWCKIKLKIYPLRCLIQLILKLDKTSQKRITISKLEMHCIELLRSFASINHV